MSNIMNGNVQVLPWFDADGKTVEKQLAEASKKQEPLEFCMPGDGEKPEDSPIFKVEPKDGKFACTFQGKEMEFGTIEDTITSVFSELHDARREREGLLDFSEAVSDLSQQDAGITL